MAELAKSLANMDAMQFEVKWMAETIGWVKDVDPSGLKLISVQQKVGELNNIVIDEWVRGLEGQIKTTIHEVKTAHIRKLMPWAGTSGSYSISPTTGVYSKYTNAQILRLHPVGDGAATNDIVFLKAFPNLMLPKNGGDDFREIQIDWDIFPDQTSLIAGTIVYGYIGDPPA